MKFWLDDCRKAPEGYIDAHSVNDLKRWIVICEYYGLPIEVIDLDHDLGDYAIFGGDRIKVLDWLIERNTFYPIRLHTMNPVGYFNMKRTIERYWPEENL